MAFNAPLFPLDSQSDLIYDWTENLAPLLYSDMSQPPVGEFDRVATFPEFSPGRHRERPKDGWLRRNGYLAGGGAGLVLVALLIGWMVGGPQLPVGPHIPDTTSDEALSDDADPQRPPEVVPTPSPSHEVVPPPVAAVPVPRSTPIPRRAPGADEADDRDSNWYRERALEPPDVEPTVEVPEVNDLPKPSPLAEESNGRGPHVDAPGQARKPPAKRER